MKKSALALTTTAILLGNTALAGPIEDIVSQFQSYGYDSIEISQSGDLVKIEGERNGTEREIVFDTASSTILSDETGPSGGDDSGEDESGEDGEDDGEEDHEDDGGHKDGEDDHDGDHDDDDDDDDDDGHDDSGDDHEDDGEDDENDN